MREIEKSFTNFNNECEMGVGNMKMLDTVENESVTRDMH